MPRYKLVIEYDGDAVRRLAAPGQRPLGAAGDRGGDRRASAGERSRIQCAGRTDAGVHATAQVAHVDLDKDWRDRHGARRPQRASAAGAGRDPVAPRRGRRLRRALLGASGGTTSTASSTAAPPPALDARPGLACALAARRRRDARRRAAPRRPPRLHDLPRRRLPGQQPGEDARPARRRRGRRRDPCLRVGALLPAPSGALDGRLARAAGVGRWPPRRARGARGARPHALRPDGAAVGLYLVGVDY